MTKAMIRFVIWTILGLGVVLPGKAQTERKFIREGNELFEKQDFEKAEVEYRKASDKKSESFEAAFNMADALYKQKKYEEALQQFTTLAKQETNKERLGEIYHNLGNTLLAMQKTEESIEAYKESLRNRPDSEATKYNLEFARHKQQQDQQQQQEQNKDQNQDQNQDQNKDQDKNQNKDQQQDQQDQNKKDQDKENQEQQNKDQQNQDKKDQQGQQQEQPSKISKEDAERLLEALQNDEKKVQEKVQKQKVQEQKARKMKIEKDW